MSISQETFDAAVKENIEDFGMEHEEAVQDAVKQFTAQGVSLSHIIKDKREDGSHNLIDNINKLQEFVSSSNLEDHETIISILRELEKECEKGIAHRLLAGKSGLYNLLISVLELSKLDSVTFQCIKTLTALTEGYPDMLNESGAKLIHSSLKSNLTSQDLSHKHLRLFRNFCSKHEGNRKMLMLDIQIAETLVEIVNKHSSSKEVVIEVSKLLRTILSDDDIRVEFGQVQVYAKILVEEYKFIGLVAQLLKEHSSSPTGLADLINTLTKLAIRNEFCQEMVDHGVLKLTLETLMNYAQDRPSVESCLRLIKALAGNDDVKHEIGKMGGIPLVILGIQRHQAVPSICEVGCSALGALALRHSENSKMICEAMGHNILVDCLKIHASKPGVIGAAARAIRNMVCRENSLAPLFLEQGAEELLNDALRKHAQCVDEVKGALRDLGCNVHLKEEWLGKAKPVLND